MSRARDEGKHRAVGARAAWVLATAGIALVVVALTREVPRKASAQALAPAVVLDGEAPPADDPVRARSVEREPARVAAIEPDASLVDPPPAANVRSGAIPPGATISLSDLHGEPLSGSVLVEPEFRSALSVELMSKDARGRASAVPLRVADGTFELQARPGTYDLRVLVHEHEVLHVVPDVEVTEEPGRVDPRLHGIDVRGRLRALEVRVVDEAGRPLANAQVGTRPAGDSFAQWKVRAASQGSVQCVSGGQRLDVRVIARGYGIAERRGISESVEIALGHDLRVRLRAQLPSTLPAGFGLEASLRHVRTLDGAEVSHLSPPNRSEIDADNLSRRPLDPREGALFEVPAAGEWRVALYLTWIDEGEQRVRFLPVARGHELVRVEDARIEQTFDVAVGTTELAQLLREIGR